MKSVVPGANIKVLARAIHSLAKIGEDLYLDPTETGLALRTVNSSRSAFVSFSFKTSFFSSFTPKTRIDGNDTRPDLSRSTSQQNSQEGKNSDDAIVDADEDSKCRVTMRGIMTAFKSIGQLEKTAESCFINICHRLNNLKIRIICKYNVTKTYTIPLIESDSLMANYDPSDLNNQFAARAKILTEAVLNFLSNQEEVTMIVTPNQFSMKNVVDDNNSNAPNKMVHTQLTMQPTEFEDFKIVKECNVTYCLKELRSLISFADALNLPMKGSFKEGGEPIVFNVDSPNLFEGTLVMASRNDIPITTKESSSSLNNSKADGHISTQESLNNSSSRVQIQHKVHEIRNTSLQDDNLETSFENDRPKENAALEPKAKHPFILSSRTEFNNTNLYASGRKNTITRETVQHIDMDMENDPSSKRKDVNDSSYETPPPSNKLKHRTPQSKKAKYTFKRTFDATFKPSDVCGTDIVLASDSGGEDN